MAKATQEETKPCGTLPPKDEKCILAEGHAGPHQDADGYTWYDRPATPKED